MSNAAEQYDVWHTEWAEREAVGGGDDPLAHPWHRTVDWLLRRRGRRIGECLEIGCGRGDFAAHLARTHPEATVSGIDFSVAAIATARQRAQCSGVAVRFEVADAQRLPFAAHSFDTVVSCECLEHVPEPWRMLSELRRVLRPGGHFILTTENYLNGMAIAWLKAWVTKTPFNSGSFVQPYENYFLYWRVRKMIEAAGLTVTHTQSNHFQWLLLPRVDPARLCTTEFRNPRWNRLFRPFGRHYTYAGVG